MTTFEIIFDTNEIDATIYPECIMFGKNSIVIDADKRYVIPRGEGKVSVFIDGELKTYENVWAVCPYVYREG